MKTLNSFNSESRTYICAVACSIITIFIISAVIFMLLISNKLDIIMSQSAKITYTYFISITNRILMLATVCFIIPISIYQIRSKHKSKADNAVSFISIFIIVVFITTIFFGEYNYFQTYKNGDLEGSVIFSHPKLETEIFDKLLNKS